MPEEPAGPVERLPADALPERVRGVPFEEGSADRLTVGLLPEPDDRDWYRR